MSASSRNYFFLTGSVFVVSVQILLAGILVCNQFPVTSRLGDTVVLEWIYMISPERELTYFRGFVMVAAAGQFGALYCFRKKLEEKSFGAPLKYYFFIELGITVYLLMFAYQTAFYGQDMVLRQTLFYVVVTFAVVHKIFFREFRRYFLRCFSFLGQAKERS